MFYIPKTKRALKYNMHKTIISWIIKQKRAECKEQNVEQIEAKKGTMKSMGS